MKKHILTVFFWLVLFLITVVLNPAYAKKPPWAGEPGGPHNQPPSAPEPFSMTLLGMGASGVVGYYLGKRKKK
jgi:LPXTG-motif cell wall-anchored protein